jgi:hypothetical protein
MTRRVVVTALLLALSTACGTARVVRLDTGQGAPLEHRPPAPTKPVQVAVGAFQEALARLVLETPLSLRPPERGWLTPVKSSGALCRAGQRGPTCLSLLDDVLGYSEWDKLGVALYLSFEPVKASISKAVEKTLAPQLFYGLITTGLVTWVVLAANPEPAFTKAAAIVSVLMLAYLGIDTFLQVVQASRELKWATDRATTMEELGQAARRFADRVGPQVARVFILAVTLAAGPGGVGGTALLASQLAMLPSFSLAAAGGASGLGIQLANVGQVSAVVVAGSTVTIALPTTAVAMAALGPETASPIDPNKLHHIFGNEEHKLGILLDKFGGSQEAAFRAVESATQSAVRSKGLSGVFTTTVEVAGQNVRVRGRVIDGVARVGSFWIP